MSLKYVKLAGSDLVFIRINMLNLPNSLTILRLVLIPVLVYVYYTPYQWLCAVLFVLACLTDWLDGYTARRRKQITPLGSFLDPVADKLLIVSIIILLISDHPIDITTPGALIILREILMSSLREWMAQFSKTIPVSNIGKVKTAFQMLSLTLLLNDQVSWVGQLGYISLWIAVVLSWWSLLNYAKYINKTTLAKGFIA